MSPAMKVDRSIRAVKWRMPWAAANAHLAGHRRSHVRMFEKSWRRLTARLNGKPHSRLRFTVHRHPEYQSFWHPSVTADQRPGLQIQIYLEASNLADNPFWIMAAE